jgi:hypothetical protein
MHVQPSAAVRLEHRAPEQSHVSRRHDDVDPTTPKEIRHGAVEGLPALEILRVEDGGLDAVGLGPFERLHGGTIREHEGDPGTADGVVEKRLQVRPGAGNEHRDPLPHGRGHATRGARPRRPYAIGVKAEERAHGIPERAEDAGSTAPEAVADPAARAGDGGSEAALHDRCVHHPSRTAIARCSACDEPVCLTCAVPVRGRVLGPECLATELGDPEISTPPEPDRAVTGSWVAFSGAVLALLATAGPWTRTGAGDRLLGAWVPSVRWSMVAAVAATTLLPAAWWFRTHTARAGAILMILGGTAIALASALAIAFPPTFQAASWGPWVAATGGAIAVAGAVANIVAEPRPRQGV